MSGQSVRTFRTHPAADTLSLLESVRPAVRAVSWAEWEATAALVIQWKAANAEFVRSKGQEATPAP